MMSRERSDGSTVHVRTHQKDGMISATTMKEKLFSMLAWNELDGYGLRN